MPKVDYNKAAEKEFSAVPAGLYEAVLDDWELKDGPKGPYYTLKFILPDEDNTTVWMNSSLSDAALWRFKRDMIRLGADPDDLAPGSEADTDDIVAGVKGASCRLKLKVQQYTKNSGEPGERNEVQEVLAPSLTI